MKFLFLLLKNRLIHPRNLKLRKNIFAPKKAISIYIHESRINNKNIEKMYQIKSFAIFNKNQGNKNVNPNDLPCIIPLFNSKQKKK